MNDEEKTKEQLTNERLQLRRRVTALEALVDQHAYTTEALQQCEFHYGQIVQSVNSIILRMDTGGTVLFLNEYGLKFFDYAEGDITGKNVIGTIVPETDTAGHDLTAIIRDIGQHPEHYANNENENMRRNGERVWVAWTNKAIYDRDGFIREILCVGNDLTAHKKAEAELQRQSHNLSKRIKELNCLYGISNTIDRQDISFDEKIKEIVSLIPAALDFSEAGCAKIIIGEQAFTTAECREEGFKITRPILVHNQKIGSIEVFYREKRPLRDEGPFQREEVNLINTVAAMLGRFITRKQAQEALIASEIKYKTLFENLPQRIFYKDKNSVYVSCNTNYAQDLGINPADITGKTDYNFFPRELAEKYRKDDRTVLDSGNMLDTEETYLQDGKETIVHTIKIPVMDGHGSIVGLLGIFRDITERKIFEREKARIEAAIQNNLTEISIKNEISEVLLSARDLTEILHMILIGATAYQALGFNRAFLFLINEHENTLEGTVATGALTPEEAYRTWARLAQERHTLTELLTTNHDDFSKDDEPINHMVRQMKMHLTEKDSTFTRAVREQHSFNIVNGSHLSSIDKNFVKSLGTETFALVPLVCRGKSLGVLLADNFINKKPIRDEDVAGLRAFANHASLAIENSRLYENLEEKVEELSTANKELSDNRDKLVKYERLSVVGEMAAKIAHDIRNPMTAIGGFARRMLEKDRGAETNKTYMNIIVQEVDRLEKILNDILGFAKPSLPRIVATDLNAIVHGAHEILTLELEKHAVSYREQFDHGLPMVHLDPDQIRRVILNLYKNAVEAMPEGGSLTVTTSIKNQWVTIETADTGTGIAEEDIDKIFDPFFTSKATGSGLGLTLAAQIISSHGGTMEVYKREPSGTIVTIQLPVNGPDEPTRSET